MNADGPRNLSVLAPFYPGCDRSHSHHPRSVCIRIHLPQRRIEEFQFGHLRFAGLWFSFSLPSGERPQIPTNPPRVSLWTAVKPRDAAPLWRGREADSGAGPMWACRTHLHADKPGSAEFIPPRRPGSRGMNSALPGEASLRGTARSFLGVLHPRKFHQIKKTYHQIVPIPTSTQFRPSSSWFRLSLSQFRPASKPFGLPSDPFNFAAKVICFASNKICLAFF